VSSEVVRNWRTKIPSHTREQSRGRVSTSARLIYKFRVLFLPPLLQCCTKNGQKPVRGVTACPLGELCCSALLPVSAGRLLSLLQVCGGCRPEPRRGCSGPRSAAEPGPARQVPAQAARGRGFPAAGAGGVRALLIPHPLLPGARQGLAGHHGQHPGRGAGHGQQRSRQGQRTTLRGGGRAAGNKRHQLGSWSLFHLIAVNRIACRRESCPSLEYRSRAYPCLAMFHLSWISSGRINRLNRLPPG
jgi:hypothetical protein